MLKNKKSESLLKKLGSILNIKTNELKKGLFLGTDFSQ
jgi:hypothetical protein